ncbi:ATP-grasp domain-containing protein [Streptomyces sp. NPDC058247]|uniref:carboxylate--amine ligase n=1 Tax=Streptomyces sp. NPDC058247 TaxID=3346401 RepID=UPI0036E48FE3
MLDTSVPAVLLRIDPNPFHHGTLGAVRSLGRTGVDVHVVAASAGSPVRRSRFLSGEHPPPGPDASLEEIGATLRRVSASVAGPAVLIPLDDAGAIAVSRLREELLTRYLLPDQPDGLTEQVADKAQLPALCEAAGIAHPATVIPDGAQGARRAVRDLGAPVVAKWSRPWLIQPGSGLRSTLVVHSEQEAAALYERAEEAGSRLLLQAYLPAGEGRDWFFHGHVDRRGVVRGGGAGCKHRSWPRGAGLTAVGRWTANPELEALVDRLVTALGYRGILDVDFRVDARTGRYCLLDFNPRPGAQFRLFADGSGLDVVRALHLDLTYRRPPVARAAPGRTFVVENYAPVSALRSLARAALPALPSQRGARARGELAWYSGDDPMPGIAMTGLWCRHVAGRLLRPAPVPPTRTEAPPAVTALDATPVMDEEKASC